MREMIQKIGSKMQIRKTLSIRLFIYFLGILLPNAALANLATVPTGVTYAVCFSDNAPYPTSQSTCYFGKSQSGDKYFIWQLLEEGFRVTAYGFDQNYETNVMFLSR